MMDTYLVAAAWVASPPVALGLMVLAALALYFLGRRLRAEGDPDPEKLEPYACGEDWPARPIEPDYGQFFAVAVLFTVFHVAAVVVATVPGGVGALGLLYLGAIALAGWALLAEARP